MTEPEMFELSFRRPSNLKKLDSRAQWKIDKQLGILDWQGGCLHTSINCCDACLTTFRKNYNCVAVSEQK